MKKRLLFFLFILAGLLSRGGTIDSLYNKIKTSPNDTVKAKSRYLLVDHYLHALNQYTIALAHCDTLEEFCKQKKFEKLYCKSLLYRAQCYEHLGRYDDAIKADSLVIAIGKQKGFKKEAAHALQNIGNNYAHMGNYTKALNSFLGSLKVQEELKDSVSMATMYHNCAVVFRITKQPQKSLEFFRKAADIRDRKKDKALASTLCSIGNLFLENIVNYDSAYWYYTKALRMAEERKLVPTIALIKENLGNLYMKKKDYRNAEKYFKENLAINEQLGEPEGISFGYYALAGLYAEMVKKELAMEYGLKALKIAEEIKNAENIKAAYGTLSEISSMVGDYKNAFRYRTLEKKMSDSLYNESGSKAMAEMSQKYETEKKQQEIELLTEKSVNQELALSKNRIVIYAVSLVLLLLLVVAFVLVRNNRIKNETNKQLTHQKHIIEEKNKEITDSIKYAQRIQNAILPDPNLVKALLPESFIYYLPKDIVSGDIYFVQSIPFENSTQIIVAAIDCTGHGVPGALVSVIGFNALNSALREYKLTEPGKILDKMRELVVQTLNTAGNLKDGMDMSLLSIQRAHNSQLPTVKWSGANNPLWIVKNNSKEVQEYKPNKQPIGHIDNAVPFTTHEIEVSSGDKLYIFTDGYADQFGGEKGKKMKSSNMKKFLSEISGESMQMQKERIQAEFQSWKNSLEQVDDVCVIGIKV